MDLFDLEAAQQHEAKRRLTLLGELAESDDNNDLLRRRSYEIGVPFQYLRAWKHAYRSDGMEGLIPHNWTVLDEASQQIAFTRFSQLASLADIIIVTKVQVCELATQNQWSYSTAERWLRRYRIGGLWALVPRNAGNKPSQGTSHRPQRDLGAFNDNALDEIYRRRTLLGELIDQTHISDRDVKKHAEEVGISPRTLWSYITAFRTDGLIGLAPQQRSDKGHLHNLSERMEHLIAGIRLSTPDIPLHKVLDESRKRAYLLGEPEPTAWQVRSVCQKLLGEITSVADKRTNIFRNKYRSTYRQRFDGDIIIYQIDTTPVDVLVKDKRGPGYQTKSGEIRPKLTYSIHASSRLILSAIFTYDTPNSINVASVIRDALLVPGQKPYGGIPDEIWVDQGKQMISKRIQEIARDLHITLHLCAPHHPEEKGIVERFLEH